MGELLEVVDPFCIDFGSPLPDEKAASVDQLIESRKRSDIWTCHGIISQHPYQRWEVINNAAEENVIMLMILNIIRNFSAEPNNELLISSSQTILRHLTSLAIAAIATDSFSEAGSIAYDILFNVASKVIYAHYAIMLNNSS